MEQDSRNSVELPDFDTMARLAKEDPAAFEAMRKRILRQAIDSAPEAHRPNLEKTLREIEATRASATTPEDAVLRANQAMMDSFNTMNAKMAEAQYALKDLDNQAKNLSAKLDPAKAHLRTFIK